MRCWVFSNQLCAHGIWNLGPSAFQSSAARNAPVLLRGFAAPFFPPLPRPLEDPRVEVEPREKDAFRPKPRFPPVVTQGSGQSNGAKISKGQRMAHVVSLPLTFTIMTLLTALDTFGTCCARCASRLGNSRFRALEAVILVTRRAGCYAEHVMRA
jgi:hypothetical protein